MIIGIIIPQAILSIKPFTLESFILSPARFSATFDNTDFTSEFTQKENQKFITGSINTIIAKSIFFIIV